MKSNLNRWGSDGAPGDYAATDMTDHWLDGALRGVPLPEGFFARLSRLSEAPPARDEDRDHNGRFAPTRGLAGTAPRGGASKRDIRSR
jgi:hypothetical protein